MNVLIAILGLELLVVIHELGHFVVARAVGMRPRRFYIGFPPAIAKFHRNGIEYGLGSIPLGGFVSIPGMHRPSPDDLDTYFGPAVHQRPELVPLVDEAKRTVAAGNPQAAERALAPLEELVEHGEIPGARGVRRGLRDLKESLAPDAYWRQSIPKRMAAILGGPAANFVAALVLFTTLFVAGSGGYRLGFVLRDHGGVTRTVDSVLKNYPAAKVGLEPGDRIVAINGKPVAPDEIRNRIGSSHGHLLALTVERSGRRLTLRPVRPHHDPRLSLPAAAWDSVRLTGEIVKLTGQGLLDLVQGHSREVQGPVGIVHESSNAAAQGAQQYLTVLGLISLSLGIFNLLPFLPLDGGHIVVAAIEGIRRRALRRESVERFAAVGFALMVVLAFIVFTNDIGRLGGG
jgi:regulator of sigma E protease